MRRPLIAGNWKMNLDRAAAVALAEGGGQGRPNGSRAWIWRSARRRATWTCVGRAVAGSKVALGAQNIYHQPNGAFTGEISAAMLCDLGCRYVILGHSERRHILGETDAAINKKVHAALAAGLVPDRLRRRDCWPSARPARRWRSSAASSTARWPGFRPSRSRGIVIAYEPVWAIGTGKVATPQQAEEVHLDLRKIMADRYNEAVAEAVRIQYGGSVKPDNAAELLGQPDIDGALVGGASLKVDQFMGIVAGAPASSAVNGQESRSFMQILFLILLFADRRCS